MAEEVKSKKSAQIDFGEYFNMLFEAAQYVWKNKVIWLIAVIGVMFGLTSSYQFSTSYNYNTNSSYNYSNFFNNGNYEEFDYNYDSSPNDMSTPFRVQQNNFEELTEFWEENLVPIIGVLIVCGLIWLVVGIIIRTAIRAALIKAGDFEQQNKKVTYKMMWEAAKSLFLHSLMIGIIAFIVYILFLFASIPLCLCVCIGWIIYIVLALLISMMQGFSYRYVLLQKKDFFESLSLTWNLIRERINDFILFIVANILIGLGYLIAFLIAIGIPSSILIIIGYGITNAIKGDGDMTFISAIPLIISVLIIVILVLIIGGFWLATSEIYFTKFFYRITKLEPGVENSSPVKKA